MMYVKRFSVPDCSEEDEGFDGSGMPPYQGIFISFRGPLDLPDPQGRINLDVCVGQECIFSLEDVNPSDVSIGLMQELAYPEDRAEE